MVDHPTVGDVSVTRAGDLWLMTYDARDPHRVVLRWSTSPFGPWSAPIALFALADGLGKFIHDPAVPGSSFGPIIGKADAATRRGGAYGPYVIERWTRRAGERLTIHYLLSTWNPYTVVLMKSELRFGKSP